MGNEEFVRALRRVDSATVSTALEGLELRDRTEGYADSRLRCLVSQPEPMVGYAVTFKVDSTTPGRVPDAAGFGWLRAAVLESPKPVVAVIQESGPTPAMGCHMGDVVGTMLARNGVVGIVSGSGVRDLSGLRALGLTALALGTVVGHGVWTITDVGVDVEVAGLPVSPGDLLHGNEDGLVKVPTEEPERLLELITELQTREAGRKASADEGWTAWGTGGAKPEAVY